MTIATMPSVKAQATVSAQPPCVRMVILFCSLIPKRYAMVGNSQFLSSQGQSIEGRDLWGFVAQGSCKKSILKVRLALFCVRVRGFEPIWQYLDSSWTRLFGHGSPLRRDILTNSSSGPFSAKHLFPSGATVRHKECSYVQHVKQCCLKAYGANSITSNRSGLLAGRRPAELKSIRGNLISEQGC
jgi:hypothetical protein